MAKNAVKPLSVEALFKRPGSAAYPFRDDRGQLCWLESLSEEGGRLALKQKCAQGVRLITPAPFQIRSSVHEYGGRCFCLAGSYIYFNHYADGLIYRQHLHDEASPVQCVSRAGKYKSAYADLHYSPALNTLIAIEEISAEKSTDNTSRIVAFALVDLALDDTDSNTKQGINSTVLEQGRDFYAKPSISPEGDKLAYITWQNPNMPWDESQLYCADIIRSKGKIATRNAIKIAGGTQQSVCQAGFLHNGEIVFALDSTPPNPNPDPAHPTQDQAYQGFWNLYRTQRGDLITLTQEKAEFGEAHWVFGQNRWQQIDDEHILAIATQDEQDRLIKINLNTQSQQTLGEPFARLSQLSVFKKDPPYSAQCIANYADRPSEIIEINEINGIIDAPSKQVHCLKAEAAWIAPEEVSKAERVQFPVKKGQVAYANFYPKSQNNTDKTTPLLVLVHGGPTSRADTALSPLIQFFCQQGFAVVDVNHRGSTGHGREYRQKLLGNWGEIDARDIIDAIEYVVKQNKLDPKRVFIRGGSAGGYAVLRALTRYPDVFRGGACYYGIGNLITLAEITHKFEGKYTDQLIGEKYDADKAMQTNSRFRTRSPIFDIDRIKSPLILFQGLEDKVVPPEVSREMVQTLEKNGVKYDYIEYAGEGHGFRQVATKIDALNREIAFYRHCLK